MAVANRARTYHNTASLMPDGRVLVAGHAPITTSYGSHQDLSDLGFSPNDGRDPSFEIYSPPYVFDPERPTIENSTHSPRGLRHGQSMNVRTADPESIESALLIRHTDITHLVDGDQRAVSLPITGRNSSGITVQVPESPAVAPAGYYMLFINERTAKGLIPSESTPVQVIAKDGKCGA